MGLLPHWQRHSWQGCPIYLHPEKPDWAVPGPGADRLLQAMQAAESLDEAARRSPDDQPLAATLLAMEQLYAQLDRGAPPPYAGRHHALTLNTLKECWFHLTNQCNLACRHCLFAASPAEKTALAPEILRRSMAEATDLGCTLFYFTGGEPFVYPDFPALLADVLANPGAHAVVLTNGLLLGEHLATLRKLPSERLHLQLSLDGLEQSHDHLRGPGTFQRLLASLRLLRAEGIQTTLSVAVNRGNLPDLPALVSLAADHGVKNIHLLWHFVRGKGTLAQFVAPAEILPVLLAAHGEAEKLGVAIDNIEALKGQVFSSPGTRHDGSNAGWESLAIGPDSMVYPSPALVGVAELACGPVTEGLEQAWRHSPVLDRIRRASHIDNAGLRANPCGFLTGGHDLDHSYLAGGAFTGHDPYVDMYADLALWLIAAQARQYPVPDDGELLLRMGDVRHDCPDGREVALTHCNCVVSLAGDHGHRPVREFYAQAAVQANTNIVNPFAPEQAAAHFIPLASRQRSYGCGSPVSDAGLKAGETLVDLGSGSGVECFLAAEKVGPQGRVCGIDMTEEMLSLARASQAEVRQRLGYDNLEFRKGFLEALPLADASADVVISNCVINLSPDKRRTFHEIFRVLNPGGRLVISDIVTDGAIPVAIKNNARFRGECLGGAMQQEELMAMLRAASFGNARLIKRFPYRLVDGVQFYSLTYCAWKPATTATAEAIYRGPFAAVVSESGITLVKGQRIAIPLADAKELDDSVLLLDETGAVTNIAMANACCSTPGEATESATGCCATPPETVAPKILPFPATTPVRHAAGCMVCGNELTYLAQPGTASCHYCGGTRTTHSVCAQGHFICDDCHQRDGLSIIRLRCTESTETDMLALLQQIRQHPAFPLHGPEHHALVPGVMVATYRNRGGNIGRETILAAIERGSKVPGGVCGFWGICGAAIGVGIGMSVLLNATPLTPEARQLAQQAAARVLGRIAETTGARCCQRESVTALQEAARLSQELLPIPLLAEFPIRCRQQAQNRECLRHLCPLWAANQNQRSSA
ncbi:MAG: DUF5714 domain-containing protein [Thermodesulfobacteriota bacterium]